MFVDVHTHDRNNDNQQVVKIVNFDFTDKIKDGDSNVLFSAGIHPWNVCQSVDFEIFDELFENKRFVAVGESGLDRAHPATFEKQREVFLKMVSLSEQIRKPLIIHAVRAYSDIISIKKEKRAAMPWIIHGFQGSPESAQQLVNHGMWLSFGEMLYRNESQAVKVLDAVPFGKMFLETDVFGRDIIGVYEKTAALTNRDVDFWEKMIFENYKGIFVYGKLEGQNANIGW